MRSDIKKHLIFFSIAACSVLIFFSIRVRKVCTISVPALEAERCPSLLVKRQPSTASLSESARNVASNFVNTPPFRYNSAQGMVVAPTGMIYKANFRVVGDAMFLPILDVVSNAVVSANRALCTKQYKNIVQFNRTVWFEAKDATQATIWRIIPRGTNFCVGAIQGIVFNDASFTQNNPAHSFQVEFYPETGDLSRFWWHDSHESLKVYKNGPFLIDYTKQQTDGLSLEMRWGESGLLISSNVYNWARRGRVIRALP